MAHNIYPCFKCGKWFDTKGEQRKHKCGSPEPKPVKQEVKEEVVEAISEEVSKEEVSSEEKVSEEFDRKEAVKALKEAGVISDGRSVTNKSNEELIEMLGEIEA